MFKARRLDRLATPARRSISTSNVSLTKTGIQGGIGSSAESPGDPKVLGHRLENLNHPVLAWLADLGATSRPTMVAALKRALRAVDPAWAARPMDFPWGRLTHLDVLRIRVGLEGRGRPASRNLSLAAVRGVARAAWRLGQLPLEELQRIAEVRNFKFHGETQAGRFVGRGERTRLFRVSAAHPIVAIRDRALFGLLLGSGLRRSEAVGLQRAHLRFEESIVTVSGKGGRTRRVPLSEPVRAGLIRWLAVLPADYEWIFPSVSRSGRFLMDRPISGAGVAELLRRRTEQEGLQRIRPHDLRRCCATDALESGADLLSIQQLLGHASPTTTALYDRRCEKSRHAAVASVFVPL